MTFAWVRNVVSPRFCWGWLLHNVGQNKLSRAYPRWRGGNIVERILAPLDEGLSPLARGKHCARLAWRRGAGPIPAGAGETRSEGVLAPFVGAYPRWRGGNRRSSWVSSSAKGLSPLARGKPRISALPGRSRGPIPAGAGETRPTSSRRTPGRAYPRWRGGNRTSVVPAHLQWGLSPLARGKPNRKSHGRQQGGPIPAGAGETIPILLSACATTAYPRWRGGNGKIHGFVVVAEGLSPLARGKRHHLYHVLALPGPIPAGAGETQRCRLPIASSGAYPRWRGGNCPVSAPSRLTSGLSPLARGKLVRPQVIVIVPGPIPAGAGETKENCHVLRLCRAYPRWRGGNMLRYARRVPALGLSPLARGKPATACGSVGGVGPIPAGAGETSSAHPASGFAGAYPRWRGGNLFREKVYAYAQGLSPLARGKLPEYRKTKSGEGPIPAGAGETQRRRLKSTGLRAYPRWRGGNTSTLPSTLPSTGLSPLARGKLAYACFVFSPSGPIPAGAGETITCNTLDAVLQAYPRWRGGNTPMRALSSRRRGLSPLARGKLRILFNEIIYLGPIPAGAGETLVGSPMIHRRKHQYSFILLKSIGDHAFDQPQAVNLNQLPRWLPEHLDPNATGFVQIPPYDDEATLRLCRIPVRQGIPDAPPDCWTHTWRDVYGWRDFQHNRRQETPVSVGHITRHYDYQRHRLPPSVAPA
jgi:hypothetical protein